MKKTKTKKQMISAQMGRCAFCGEPVHTTPKAELTKDSWKTRPTLDHLIPLIKGGSWEQENLVVVHSYCNMFKSDLLPNEVLELAERLAKNMRITFESRGLLK